MIAASEQDGTHPRPTLIRESWLDLDGEWEFSFDDTDVGRRERWFRAGSVAFEHRIQVPFSFEAPLSGIDDTTPHEVVWYRRAFEVEKKDDERVVLHFGAVDHEAEVWIDGAVVASHRGGQTAFSADVTDSLDPSLSTHEVVVRAADSLANADQPRGKQDWRAEMHEVWYRRATGIWRSVWIEVVPRLSVKEIDWRPDLAAGRLEATVWLNRDPLASTTVQVSIAHDGQPLAGASASATTRRVELAIDLAFLRNGQERLSMLWRPDQPVLVDAEIAVSVAGAVVDTAWSYAGLRSVGTGSAHFLLNDRPIYVRSVLAQNYWPDGAWTAPSAAHLRAEVEAILSLGFNSVRVHQKIEDPRFLYWCDRLGLMVWAEIGAAYGFSADAVDLFTGEWLESVRQRRAHPSVVVWVPFNESWGVPDLTRSPAQRDFIRGIVGLTRAVGGDRPVISNDGWEHVDSDILTIHDYSADPEMIARRFGTAEGLAELLAGSSSGGYRVLLEGQQTEDADGRLPVMLTEFGGVAFAADDTWGYSVAADDEQYASAIGGLFKATIGSRLLSGFCYTQLTDTAQEANGLLRSDRSPKLSVDLIRSMVRGTVEDA